MRNISILLLLFSILFVQAQPKKREMRAVWIATVANIDWPSSPNLTAYAQREEMRKMLDRFSENNINAIIMQIRPTADAFYPSSYEPWSNWLTGKQGDKPQPYYDPLQFVIEEAHKRCIEVHVWLNPYRVINSQHKPEDILHKDHLFFKKRDLFVEYGGKYYFDPGLDETRQFLNKVVEDIVMRYDVDAVHFDDYFYPYKVAGKDFPDGETFKSYPRGFAANQKDDWRRNNVDMIISELRQTIKTLKPWVEFGISPFGVWRNNNVDPRGSATRAGAQNYDDLYADILKWLDEGSIDYVMPQLYWEIGKKVADYEVLIKWWAENSYNRNLYIGLFASGLKVNKATAWNSGNELARQMNMNKKYSNKVDGVAFYSARPFLENRLSLLDSLQANYFKYPALVPVNRNDPAKSSLAPINIRTVKDGDEAYLLWDDMNSGMNGYETAYYVVYAFKGKKVGDLNNPANIVVRTTENCVDLHALKKRLKGQYTFVVTTVNRYKYESIPTHAVTRKM